MSRLWMGGQEKYKSTAWAVLCISNDETISGARATLHLPAQGQLSPLAPGSAG